MQPRHRIPTIFTLYMVDVLCCALGCVVLLWQVNHQEAQDQTAVASDAHKKIADLEGKLDASRKTAVALGTTVQSLEAALDASRKSEGAALVTIASLSSDVKALNMALQTSKQQAALLTIQVADLRKDRDRAQDLALVTKKELDASQNALALAQTVLANLRSDLKNLQVKQTGTAEELAAKLKEQAALLKKLKGAELQIVVLEKDLASKLLLNEGSTKQVQDLTAKLKETEAHAKKLEQTLDSLQLLSRDYISKLKVADIRSALLERDLEKNKKDILEAAKRYQELVAAQELIAKRLKITDKDLEEAKATIKSLQGERLGLVLQARLLKEAADNRFAGIKLTGENVVFLVDMSGSMALLDAATEDPDKWPEVCDTVVKIMKSLPDLKKYQVILFSDRVRYAFGGPGRWLEYNPQTTPKTVFNGLKAVKAEGETDMYAAFEEAFKFRAQGLDTIYVLSDGLPTTGAGLPSDPSRLSETQKTELLSKHLRARLKNNWNAPLAGKRVRINAIGFFFESPDVGAFLWALAREHEGSFVGMR